MKKKIILGILLLMSACGKKKNESVLNMAMKSDPLTFDARKSGDFYSSTVLFLLNQGLVKYDRNKNILPALAESYEISEDKKTYIFHLKNDITWSDGHPITAYDFEKSWKKILDPQFPSLCPQLLYSIKNAEKASKNLISLDDIEIKASNAKTLIVQLENPTPYFLDLTGFCLFFPIPSHKENIFRSSDYKNFVSNGPFILEKYTPNHELILKKNPKFWDAENVHLKKIHIHIIKNDTTSLSMYEKNELDWIGTPLSPLPLDALENLKTKKEFSSFPVGGTTFIVFNVENPLFKNKKIRKALSLSIDRKEIVDHITQLNEPIANRCIPPLLTKGIDRNIIENNNPGSAKKLFEEGLLEEGLSRKDFQPEFLTGTSFLHRKIAETLQQKWQKNLGITVWLTPREEKMYHEKLHRHDFSFGLALWIAQFNDPMNILERFKYKNHTKNYAHWENPSYIQKLNEIIKTADLNLRELKINEAESIFMEEHPIAPLYHHCYSLMIKENIQGLFVGPVGDIHIENAVKK